VFVSSHLLAEVEQICTHAAIMSAGRLVAQGTLADLRGAGQARIRVLTPDPGAATQVLARLGLAATLSPDGGGPSGGAASGAGAVLVAPLPAGWPETASRDSAVRPETAQPGHTQYGRAHGTAGDAVGPGEPAGPEAVVAALVAAGVRVRGFATEQVSLEDRFVALTGEGFDVVQ